MTACGRRRRPDCRRIVDDDAQTSTSAGAKVQGINVMNGASARNSLTPTMGRRPYGAPKSIMWLGDDHSDDDAIRESPQAGALIRRLGLVCSAQPTLNRRGSPWVGNDPKSPKSGALIRRVGLGIDPKQARGIRRLGQEMALNSGARNLLPWV